MMLRSPPPPRLKVVDLNPHLSCILCGGYFIDATTITECLHSFCRACIVRYLETSEYCPVCEVQVHKSKPLRSDKILQDIVYKLVPGLFHNEMKRRRELYASQPPEALKESRDAEDRGECLDEKFIYAPDEIFSLSIEYGKETENKDPAPEEDNVPKRRFLRCPAAVTVSHLKKFVRMKYGIPNSYEIDLKYDKESLRDEYTLIDVAYIFLWRRKGPMRFFYKIVEKPPKKMKLEPHIFLDDSIDTENVTTKEAVKDTKEPEVTEGTTTCEPPVQSVVPQSSEKETTPPPTAATTKAAEPAVAEQKHPSDLQPVAEDVPPVSIPLSSTPVDSETAKKTEAKEPTTEVVPVSVSSSSHVKKDAKSIPFKFPPISQMSKNCCSSSSTSPSSSTNAESNKPAVMTVAPLTKPSSSLPTTSTSPTSVTHHGLYTGISIKKSPPNTLPPFKISTHLLTPKVPPLKLSPPRFSKLETCLRELSSSSSKKSSASKKSRSSRGSSDKLELKVAQLKSASIKCVAPLVITVPPEAKLLDSRKDVVGSSSAFLPPPLSCPEKKAEVTKSPTTKVTPIEPPRDKEPLPTTTVPAAVVLPPLPIPAPPPPPPVVEPKVLPPEEDKMDLDSDLFEGRLVIAEPDIPPKDDSDNSNSCGGGSNKPVLQQPPPTVAPPPQQQQQPPPKEPSPKPDDSEDEEIDVVDDGEVDSGRGSDVSSRTEARSLCGFDDDLGSPDSVPKTPEAERHPPPPPPPPPHPPVVSVSNQQLPVFLPDPKSTPKVNGVAASLKNSTNSSGLSNGSSSSNNDCGVLDLSTCSRKRGHEGGDADAPVHHRSRQVANPAVLDKTRQTTTPCISPNHTPFKVLTAAPPDHHLSSHHMGLYKGGKHHESSSSSRGNFKCRGNTLTVINPDPNGSRPKIVIRNLGPRPDRGQERFHHHHHHHHNHHQRM